MPRFKPGDRVERIGSMVPTYMKEGIVISVAPNHLGAEWLTEYEVEFTYLKATFYETQLRLVKPSRETEEFR